MTFECKSNLFDAHAASVDACRFFTTMGASHPLCYVGLVVFIALIMALDHNSLAIRDKNALFPPWLSVALVAIYAVSGTLHIIGIFVLESNGPMWADLYSELTFFIYTVLGQRILYPLLWLPLRCWPITLVVGSLYAFIADVIVQYTKRSREGAMEIVVCMLIITDVFVVFASLLYY